MVESFGEQLRLALTPHELQQVTNRMNHDLQDGRGQYRHAPTYLTAEGGVRQGHPPSGQIRQPRRGFPASPSTRPRGVPQSTVYATACWTSLPVDFRTLEVMPGRRLVTE